MLEIKRKYNKLNGEIIITDELIKFIENEYKKGLSQRSIAKLLNIGEHTIRRIMKENHIYIRDNREQALKNECNEDYFSIINSEEKAYWLGFLYADGYILSESKNSNKKLGITIASIDREHLIKFKKCINFTGEIKDYTSKSFGKTCNYSKVIISNVKIVEDLIDKGCIEHKTNILCFPIESQVPHKLLRHFLRGYIDGDGSITGYVNKYNNFEPSIKIVGTKEIIDGFQNYLGLSLKIHNRFPNRNKNNYTLAIGGRLQVINILNLLYGNSLIYLDRKYEKYKNICM